MTTNVAFLFNVEPKSSRQRLSEDKPIPFDADEVQRNMAEARIRVARLSPPGVWAWARTNRATLMESLEKMKKSYEESFTAEDMPHCLRWTYCIERRAKQIIREYVDAISRQQQQKKQQEGSSHDNY